MNSKFFFKLIVVIAAVACNNPAAKQVPPGSDAVETPSPKKDSTPAQKNIPPHDTAAKPSSYELTTTEMQDDSVFTDGSQPASSGNAGFDHPIAFKKFLKRLQYWVANDQKDSVAAVIRYPLKKPAVKNKAAFLAKYDELMNAKVKKALLTQNLRQIFRRDQGAMIGNGELWFNESPKGFTIITINNN